MYNELCSETGRTELLVRNIGVAYLKNKEIDSLQNKIARVKKAFDDVDFKKATFGSSYSLSSEDLEVLTKVFRQI